LPSASLSGVPDGKGRCNGIYEPIHGKHPESFVRGTMLIIFRVCAGHFWKGNREPCRNYSFGSHDAPVFPSPPCRVKGRRRGSTKND
jgi:hypothetical protein